jgi:C-terminal processing protease CtpA/Prc
VIFKVGHDGGMYVKALSEDGAAKASGVIQIDDLLMEVNGKPVYRKAVTLVTPMLLGSFGTVIVLTFARKGENGKEATVKVKLVRGTPDRIPVPSTCFQPSIPEPQTQRQEREKRVIAQSFKARGGQNLRSRNRMAGEWKARDLQHKRPKA